MKAEGPHPSRPMGVAAQRAKHLSSMPAGVAPGTLIAGPNKAAAKPGPVAMPRHPCGRIVTPEALQGPWPPTRSWNPCLKHPGRDRPAMAGASGFQTGGLLDGRCPDGSGIDAAVATPHPPASSRSDSTEHVDDRGGFRRHMVRRGVLAARGAGVPRRLGEPFRPTRAPTRCAAATGRPIPMARGSLVRCRSGAILGPWRWNLRAGSPAFPALAPG